MRDPDSGNSKGFGFVSYDSFEASDAAIEVGACFFLPLVSHFCSILAFLYFLLVHCFANLILTCIPWLMSPSLTLLLFFVTQLSCPEYSIKLLSIDFPLVCLRP